MTLIVMANGCTLDFQSKSPDYYQSSLVVLKRESAFRNLNLYAYHRAKSSEKSSYEIVVTFLQLKKVCSIQTQIGLRLCTHLHQNITSFIKQSVFVNEIIISGNFHKSLYTA